MPPILRVHDKVRGELRPDSRSVHRPSRLIVGRGIDDVAILALTLSAPEAGSRARMTRQRPDPHRARAAAPRWPRFQDVGSDLPRRRKPLKGDARCPRSRRGWRSIGVTLQQLAGQGRSGANTGPFPAGTRARRGPADPARGGRDPAFAPAEIGNLLLTARDGRPVYVRDVADVGFSFPRPRARSSRTSPAARIRTSRRHTGPVRHPRRGQARRRQTR